MQQFAERIRELLAASLCEEGSLKVPDADALQEFWSAMCHCKYEFDADLVPGIFLRLFGKAFRGTCFDSTSTSF